MKPYWFKLTENDEPSFIKPKNHRFLILLIGITIGFMGSYFLIPQKVANAPITQTIVKPSVIKSPIASPGIKNPMLNPSDDEDEDEDD